MYYFHNDYNEICHSAVLAHLQAIAGEGNPGYGADNHCRTAAERIRSLCQAPLAQVHFLVGGTQANLTVIAAALRPHQGVVGAESAHIHVHETGAVEATGHKVITLASSDGKVSADALTAMLEQTVHSMDAEHMVQPKMVYLSHPTELGTLYTRQELEKISNICKDYGLYLFVDGARLGYGLTAEGADVTLKDLAQLCDVFYIGGTKCGTMFGEAVVITNSTIAEDFRYILKQRGGMMAKGWLLGAQFEAIFEDDRYQKICRRANLLADRIRDALSMAGYPLLVPGRTNQIFPILPDALLDKLKDRFTFSQMHRVDPEHRAVRFCTSWATEEQAVEELCRALKNS